MNTDSTKTKHTAGPWRALHDLDGDYAIFGPGPGQLIAVTMGDSDLDAANAHLIAGAPELLEALKAVLPLLQNEGADGYAVNEAEKTRKHLYTRAAMTVQAAIAKAGG